MRILSIFIITLFVFSSCSKEKTAIDLGPSEVNTNGTNQREVLFNPKPSPRAAEIKTKIKDFSDRLNAVRKGETGAKDGELSLNDATWNIEALLNASYTNANTSFSRTKKSKYSFTVPVSNGNVSNENLLSAFETARGYLASEYNSIDSDFRMPLSIDLKEINVADSQVEYEVTNLIAIKPGVVSQTPFHEDTDWWYATDGLGRCGPAEDISNGNDDNLDAADILEIEINQRYPVPGTHLYFVGLDAFNGKNSMSWTNPDWDGVDFCKSSFIWHRGNFDLTQTCGYCISPDDLDWYYNNIFDLIDEGHPLIDDGWEFNFFTMTDNHILGFPEMHQFVIRWGESVTCFDCQPCDPNIPDCPCVSSC